MSHLALKKQVLEKISNADENLLKKIKAAINDYEDNTIVAHTVSGKPLNKKEYREEVLKAEQEFIEGKYFSTEELKQEMANWKK